MVLAFVPLFFAVASLTEASLLGARQEGALALARAIAIDLDEARSRSTGAGLSDVHVIERHVRSHDDAAGAFESLIAFDSEGRAIAWAGAVTADGRAIRLALPVRETVRLLRAQGAS